MSVERSEVLAADGTSIPVWISGSGPPLLIVHGASGTHETWEPLRPHLDGDRTVAIMDRRASFGDPLGQLSLETEFDDITRVAGTLGEGVDLFGHSSGALCAMGAALRMPNLRRLVLYEPPMVAGVEPSPEQMAIFGQLYERLHAGDAEGIHEIFIRDIAGPGIAEPESWARAMEGFRAQAKYIPRELAAIGQCTSLAPEAFANVHAPTLFLGGSKTPDGPNSWYREALQATMPNFTSSEIPGQEHWAGTYAPEKLAHQVRAFLEADTPAATA